MSCFSLFEVNGLESQPPTMAVAEPAEAEAEAEEETRASEDDEVQPTL